MLDGRGPGYVEDDYNPPKVYMQRAATQAQPIPQRGSGWLRRLGPNRQGPADLALLVIIRCPRMLSWYRQNARPLATFTC